MKASELMIGDWVLAEGMPVMVTNLSILGGDIICAMKPFMSYDVAYAANKVALANGAQSIKKIKPMPLTTEILESNFHEPNEGVVWWKNDEPFYHVECLPLNGTRLIIPYAQYVHELQHALRLSGIDKEITF